MKYPTFIKVAFFSLLAICGCDNEFYYSSVPISDSKHSTIDSSVIGYWKHAGWDYGSYDIYMKVLPIDEREIVVDIVGFSEDTVIAFGDIWYTYLGYTSNINGIKYYNLKKLDGNSDDYIQQYCFFKVMVEGDSLFTHYLHEDFELEPRSSREFRRYIRKNPSTFDTLFVEGYRFKRY